MKRTNGPYEILEILGEGSFGTVCVARLRNDPLRRKVALKILKNAYTKNKKITDRTRDEAKLLHQLTHPNVVRVAGMREINGRPVLIMEHVEGVSLEQLLMRFKDGLPAIIALEVIRCTSAALHAAYAEAVGENNRPLRVIHRDIKPSNIMLSNHGEVKVLDFGIAQGNFEGRAARTESVVMGSRPYMAPERLDGVSDTAAVDVYSAGMTMYELLTGRPMNLSINPTQHDTAMSRQLQYIQVQGMSAAAQEDLRDLIRRMCAYNRDFRPSANEVARDIEQLMYAIDRRYHIQIDEFARSTVLPIYESRQRTMPESGEGDDGDELLKEVTGAIGSTAPGPTGRFTYVPYLFVGVLGSVVVLLLVMAGFKFTSGRSHLPDDRVHVDVWIPIGCQASMGDVNLAEKGGARVKPGLTTLNLSFGDDRVVRCQFEAREGTSVRWVGNDSITIDDGDAVPCVTGTAKN